jgi:hypothetical protein
VTRILIAGGILSFESYSAVSNDAYNNSLDASGGGVFVNFIGAAEGALIRAAASTDVMRLSIIQTNAILIASLIVGSGAFGQHSKPIPAGGSTASKSRPSPAKAKPSPPASPSYSACGVPIPTYTEFLDEIKMEWRIATENDDKSFLYNTRKTVCDRETGILSVWVKVVFKKPQENGQEYQIVKHQFKCRSNQLRATNLVSYDKDGKVIVSTEEDKNTEWSEAIPDSIADGLLKVVCRKIP